MPALLRLSGAAERDPAIAFDGPALEALVTAAHRDLVEGLKVAG